MVMDPNIRKEAGQYANEFFEEHIGSKYNMNQCNDYLNDSFRAIFKTGFCGIFEVLELHYNVREDRIGAVDQQKLAASRKDAQSILQRSFRDQKSPLQKGIPGSAGKATLEVPEPKDEFLADIENAANYMFSEDMLKECKKLLRIWTLRRNNKKRMSKQDIELILKEKGLIE